MKHLLFNADFGKPETVIVLGVGRGGTSLVAGTLRCLGISMGEDPHPAKHEWSPVVYTPERQVNVPATRRNVEAMNAAHPLWGWKSPADLFVVDALLPLLRGPAFLIVTRDLVNVTLSSQKYDGTPPEIGFYEAAIVYRLIADRMRFWPYPAAVVPFQEILENADEFVEFIASFLQITPTAEQKKGALAFNKPGSNAYQSIDANLPAVISSEDLQMDIDALAASYIGRYAEEYLQQTARVKTEADGTVSKLCKQLADPRAEEILESLISRMKQLFVQFAVDIPPAAAAEHRSHAARSNAGTSLEVAAVREMLAEIGRAAERIAESLKEPALSATEGYHRLLQLNRVLLLMIRVRIELQKTLQFFAASTS